MDLYFAPLACSMATRIALYEAGAEAGFIEVDQKAKRAADEDFWAINPMGLVPVLRTDDGKLLTENVAVLTHVAEAFPDAGIGHENRYALLQWLAFVSTEIHKPVFIPLLGDSTPEEVKAYARKIAERPLGVLEKHLCVHDTLLGRFTVADAYLVTVLNWAYRTKVLDLSPWPVVLAYFKRQFERPAIKRAFAEELVLYEAERARRNAA